MDEQAVLEGYGITLFMRDGKFYWTIKSKSFDSMDEAYKDATTSFKGASGAVHFKGSQDLHSL